MSNGSTGSTKHKWLKAFKSLKTSSPPTPPSGDKSVYFLESFLKTEVHSRSVTRVLIRYRLFFFNLVSVSLVFYLTVPLRSCCLNNWNCCFVNARLTQRKTGNVPCCFNGRRHVQVKTHASHVCN